MARALVGLSFAEPFWVDDVYSTDYGQKKLNARLPQSPVRVITTRIDNDDAFIPSFMAEVRNAAMNEEFAFVNFSHGAQLAGGRVYWLSDPANPFLSLLEVLRDGDQCQTVLLDEHEKAATHAPVRQLSTRPAWLQVVHGGNIENAVRGLRANPRRVLPAFPIFVDTVHVSRVEMFRDQIRTGASLLVRILQDPRRLKKLWRVV